MGNKTAETSIGIELVSEVQRLHSQIHHYLLTVVPFIRNVPCLEKALNHQAVRMQFV
jgi:hypothetical protein